MGTATSSRSLRTTIWTPFSRVPTSITFCCTWIAIVAIIGLTARWLAPYDYLGQDPLAFRTALQSYAHFLGTDYLRRDVVSNLLVATQRTLMISIVESLICALIGTSLGLLAAHFGGWVDNAIMGFTDAMASVPFIIIDLDVLAAFGSTPLLFLFLMGMFNWWRYARLTRALVISANEEDYAKAARIVGVPSMRLYLCHMLSNIADPLIVQFTANFPDIILLESKLSFLRLGIQPPATSLSLMVADGHNYLTIAWWLAAFPGTVIVLTTLSISLLGDFMRDRFDVRLR